MPVPPRYARIAFATCVVSGITPSWAWGWEQYRTPQTPACGVRWYSSDSAAARVPLLVDQDGLETVGAPQLLNTVAQASSSWSTTSCQALPKGAAVQLTVDGLAAPTPTGAQCIADGNQPCAAKASNGNFVRAIRSSSEWPYGSMVFGLTVLTYNTCSGEIVDGDILLDDASHDFCAGSCKPGQQDLCNTLTHELGHLLGLDHSAVAEATMFASAPAGETQKCSLETDDRLGLCAVYSGGCGKGHTCNGGPGVDSPAAPPDDGCQMGRAAKPDGWWLAIGCALLLYCQRRRTCASTSSTDRT